MSRPRCPRARWCASALVLFTCALLVACAQDTSPLTEVIVTIDADDSVAASLTSVEIATYAVDELQDDTKREPITSGVLTLHADKPGPGTADFPFSIGVVKAKADRFLLVVTGYVGREPVIEQKARVAFLRGKVGGVGIYLGSPCYGQLCGGVDGSDWLTSTCMAESGSCGELDTRTPTRLAIGTELDAGLTPMRTPERDAQLDAELEPFDAREPVRDGASEPLADSADEAGRDAGVDADVPPLPSDYALAVAGTPCTDRQNQTLACEGHASRKVLKCNRGIWELFETCAEGARCDSRVGVGQGTCVSMPAPCVGKAAGDVCEGAAKRACGVDLVSLSDSPCQVHARCDAASGSARCVCDAGFDADAQGSCVDHVDCPVGACAGGACVDGLSDYQCSCDSGFTGTGTKSCTPVMYCPKDACAPGGSCVDVADWSCHCSAGFAGEGTRACTNTNDCPSDRCKAPNGVCRDGVSSYSCDCNTGFSGPDCLVDVCNPSPCQHGGVCSRTPTGASCDCGNSGYSGPTCATNTNECASANLCTWPDYPCVQTTSPGYACQGQFADWPMPDALSGAKTVPSYDTSTSGSVVDNVSGLAWQASLPPTYAGCSGRYTNGQGQAGDACSFADAKKYCEGLSLAGHSDWRLPSKIELESIVDETKFNPSIDPGAFIGTPAELFWSSSSSSPGNAWFVFFYSGYSDDIDMNSNYRVRCVRTHASPLGATPAEHYQVDTAAGTVTDRRTGLIWQRLSKLGTFNWAGAKAQCSAGFRLPALKELLTLVDPTRAQPSSDPVLRGENESQNTPPELFWSASPSIGAPGSAWQVNFESGYSDQNVTSGLARVRCVR